MRSTRLSRSPTKNSSSSYTDIEQSFYRKLKLKSHKNRRQFKLTTQKKEESQKKGRTDFVIKEERGNNGGSTQNLNFLQSRTTKAYITPPITSRNEKSIDYIKEKSLNPNKDKFQFSNYFQINKTYTIREDLKNKMLRTFQFGKSKNQNRSKLTDNSVSKAGQSSPISINSTKKKFENSMNEIIHNSKKKKNLSQRRMTLR